jgi:acyl transferase domain-containing protein/acyl carrier protein
MTKELTPLRRALLAVDELRARLAAAEQWRDEPIAIVGIGCRFPGGAVGPDAFWKMLCDGTDAVQETPVSRWDLREYYDPDPTAPGKVSTRHLATIGEVDRFDAQFFGIAPREAVSVDPQQRLLLEVTWEAFEHAGVPADRLLGSRTGVFVGICASDYMTMQMKWNDPERVGAHYGSGIAHSMAAGRLSYVFGLQGPSVALDTSCSSSLVAVHLACQSLRLRECGLALAGGVHLCLSPEAEITMSKARMLAADGKCKTFDASADGFVEGEGCGIVVLKRLSEAVADGDRIIAVIRGSGVNQDGPSSGLTVPNGPAQEAVIRAALDMARLPGSAIDYVEAHGTGTPLGDPIEVQALAAALGEGRPADRPLVIGSLKTNIGHLQSAAGIAGLIKVALALQKSEIPRHLHFQEPNKYIPWDALPVEVATTHRAWPERDKPRAAGVSSFGFSGTNAHVVLEQAPARVVHDAGTDRPLHVLTVSAKSEPALVDLARQYAGCLPQGGSPADVAFSANSGRSHFAHRFAVIGRSSDDLRAGVDAFASGSRDNAAVLPADADRPKVAFLFTGQGSQYTGMGRELYDSNPVFRDAFDRCDRALRSELEHPLLSVVFPEHAGDTRLDRTEYTQPALFAIEYALATLWTSWGVTPSAMLGHSVGEYVAACLAGVFSLEDALRLVAVRARLMQRLPAGGVMTAVIGSESGVREILDRSGDGVDIAAINGPELVVIAGSETAMAAVEPLLSARRMSIERLRVSHAFHSRLVEPMLDEFEQVARSLQYESPRIAMVSNVTGAAARAEFADPGYWRRHVRMPVRFADSMTSLVRQGYTRFLEIGPHPTLTGMARRAHCENTLVWAASLRRGKGSWEQILESLRSLYLSGVDVDWKAFERPYTRRRIALPTYPFQRERFWIAGPPPAALSPGAKAATAAHPLLGARVDSPLPQWQFTADLDLDAVPFLVDHRKYGAIVFPATAFIEMMRSAAVAATGSSACAIDDLIISNPLVIESAGAAGVTLQTIVDIDDERASVRVFSRLREGDGRWRLHARADITRDAATAIAGADIAAIRDRVAEEVTSAAYYERLSADGHQYGPSFQAVDRLWRIDGEAIAEISLPDSAITPTGDRFGLHPVVLDATLQVLGAALPAAALDTTRGDTFLPISFERITAMKTLPSSVVAHVQLRKDAEAGSDAFVGDVTVYDRSNAVVATISSMQIRRASREAMEKAVRGAQPEGLYEVVWRQIPKAEGTPAGAPRRTWLLLADNAGVASGIARTVEARGDRCISVEAADRYEAASADRISLDPRDRDHYRRLMTDVNEGLEGELVIVHLWTLSEPSHVPTAARFLDEQTLGLRSLFHLVQACVTGELSALPALTVVTRGAQAIGRADAAPTNHATIWGFCRTLSHEHPNLHNRCIDLGPEGSEAAAAIVLEEMSATDGENEVSYRAGVRHAPRMTRAAALKTSADGPDAVELTITDRGVLDNLSYIAATRRAPAAREVEIAVEATGLNFRDVLNAMGVYEGHPGPLGSECAGRIVRVGTDVTEFKVGDEVLATAAGTFRTFVTVDAVLVVAKPPALTFEDAATIPIAFLTAQHALSSLKRGQRVLIHAGAGGVGMAAVQLALRAGAEVFATAGSPEKRAFLTSMGVRHVMSSRTLDFSDAVLTETGGQGVDLVLNALNGEFIPRSLATLSTGGTFVEIGKAGIWTNEQMASARPDVIYVPFYLADLGNAAIGAMLAGLVQAFADGSLKPLPHRLFDAENVTDAFRFMAQAKHIGKVIVRQAPPVAEQPLAIRPDATYLVTGGLGALGLTIARALVDRGARTLALVGRKGPSEDQRRAIQVLEDRGARVALLQADVSRRTDVESLVGQIAKELPPLAGLVHAAGVLDDGVLTQQSWDRFERVLAPKAVGAWHLHEATERMPLDFFVMFSSIAAIVGAPGQSNYSAANAALDALAQRRARMGLRALSINWGPWADGGMATSIGARDRERFSQLGIELISPVRGTEHLHALIASRRANAVVFPADWRRFRNAFAAMDTPSVIRELVRDAAGPQKAVARQKVDLARIVNEALAGQRADLVSQFVQREAAKALGLTDGRLPDLRTPLNDLGLDSLMAIELRNGIGAAVGRTLPATLVYKYPTLDALARYLLIDVLGHATAAPAETQRQDADEAEIEPLTDEEAKKLLAEELQLLSIASEGEER